jgi:hypothetical protein
MNLAMDALSPILASLMTTLRSRVRVRVGVRAAHARRPATFVTFRGSGLPAAALA